MTEMKQHHGQLHYDQLAFHAIALCTPHEMECYYLSSGTRAVTAVLETTSRCGTWNATL